MGRRKSGFSHGGFARKLKVRAVRLGLTRRLNDKQERAMINTDESSSRELTQVVIIFDFAFDVVSRAENKTPSQARLAASLAYPRRNLLDSASRTGQCAVPASVRRVLGRRHHVVGRPELPHSQQSRKYRPHQPEIWQQR